MANWSPSTWGMSDSKWTRLRVISTSPRVQTGNARDAGAAEGAGDGLVASVAGGDEALEGGDASSRGGAVAWGLASGAVGGAAGAAWGEGASSAPASGGAFWSP